MLLFSRCSSAMSCFSCNKVESKANSILVAGWAGLLVGVLLTGQPCPLQASQDFPSSSKVSKTQLLALPMQFEANAGQVDAQVEFLSRGQGYTLWLSKTQAVLSLRASEGRQGGKPPQSL